MSTSLPLDPVELRYKPLQQVPISQCLTDCYYCMIGLCHLMAGDDSCMAGGESRMVGGESRMTGDCCRPEGSIHRCVRTHSHLYSYIYRLVALLDNIQSSFSSITISTVTSRSRYKFTSCGAFRSNCVTNSSSQRPFSYG